MDAVANDPEGIGYSGIGWKTSAVRALQLSETAGHFVPPTYKNALSGEYPLSRFLYIYVNQQPSQPLDKLTGEFIKYVLAREGQEAVVEARFFPLPAKIVTETSKGQN